MSECGRNTLCGECLCSPGLVKLRAVMDVNRLATPYCVNINHQARTPPPHTAPLNIHNTLHASQTPGQPQISTHMYTHTCTQAFPFSFPVTVSLFLFSHSFIFDCPLARPCFLPLYCPRVSPPLHLPVNHCG